MATVLVWGNLSGAIRKFNDLVGNEGIVSAHGARARGYLKPSLKRRLKHFRAVNRLRREEVRRWSR